MREELEEYLPLAKEVLLEAKKIITLSGGIGKGVFVRHKEYDFLADTDNREVIEHPENYCFCTVGALRTAAWRVLPNSERDTRYQVVTTAVMLVVDCITDNEFVHPTDVRNRIYAFNDDNKTTTKDVFKQIDCAVEKVK